MKDNYDLYEGLLDGHGLDCYEETAEGLCFEIKFTNRDYILSWLLGFGSNVKVLEPKSVVEDIKRAAENILLRYK
jgi:predicted DNA-binding transcriptional regulator YafY